jgi:hypothetical protein
MWRLRLDALMTVCCQVREKRELRAAKVQPVGQDRLTTGALQDKHEMASEHSFCGCRSPICRVGMHDRTRALSFLPIELDMRKSVRTSIELELSSQ